MKFRIIRNSLLLGTAALLFTGVSARAGLNYTPGDLFIGFQQTGNSTDYLVDIGNVSQFSHLDGSSFTVNLGGSIGDDLASTFTSNWATSTTVFWSVTGTTFSNVPDSSTIYLTKARSNINNQTTPWLSNTPNGQLDQVGDFQEVASAYTGSGTATGDGITSGSTKATFQSTSLANSYASFTQGTSADFQWGNIEGKFGPAGASGSVLDLYQVTPSLNQSPATYLGKFSINGSGVVTFTSASPVPEPSAYGLAIASGLFLLIFARRRRAAANA